MNPRRGVALIMAIALLAALLLLGLPFLFMQSASVAGARSMAAHQQAQAVAEGLRAYGVGLGAATVEAALAAGATASGTSLTATIADLGLPSATEAATAPNRLTITLPGGSGTAGSVLTALTIEDEQGKLDANHLGPMGWTRLFALVGISDWDDSAVDAQARIDAGYYGTQANGTQVALNDGNVCGQLADALANLRVQGAFTSLEDLLAADPGYPAIFRPKLTRTELEQLRPHVTVHTLAQARGGIIDGGTVVAVGPDPSTRSILVDGMAPIGAETWVLSGTGATTAATAFTSTSSTDPTVFVLTIGAAPAIGDQLHLLPASAVNIHQASATVRSWWAAQAGGLAVSGQVIPDLAGTRLAGRAGLASVGLLGGGTAWTYTNPLWHAASGERPQLDTASGGWFLLAAATDVTDSTRRLASAGRRQVVQALPQGGLLERRWTTQADFAWQMGARTAPGMTSWPRPLERLAGVTPADPAPAGGDGMTFAPLAPGIWSLPAATAGATAALVGSTIQASLFSTDGAAMDRSRILADGLLGPDGIRLPATGVRLQSTDSGLLNGSGFTWSGWIRPEAGWSGAVPLLDARARSDRVAYATLDGVAGDPDRQSRFALFYDTSKQALVALWAPPGAGISDASGFPAIQGDDPLTPDVDERCLLAGSGSTGWLTGAALAGPACDLRLLSGAWQPHQTMHLVALPGGLVAGQWYRIQVLATGSRPGGNMSVLVDGCAGRDVTRIPVGSSYQKRWCDQTTLPALVLAQDLPAASTTVAWTSGATPPTGSRWIPSIEVRVPALAAEIGGGGLGLSHLLPPQGTVLIAGESIAYATVQDRGDGTGALAWCRRGARSAATAQVLPAHARGSVMAGHGHVAVADPTIMRTGGATLAAALGTSSPEVAIPPNGTATLPTVLTVPSAGDWPEQGLVMLQQTTGAVAFRTFIRSGILLTLAPPTLPARLPATLLANPDPAWDPSAQGWATLISAEIAVENGDVPTQERFLLASGDLLLQVADPATQAGVAHGAVEWIRLPAYVGNANTQGGIVSASIGEATRHFLINTQGWSSGRGQYRTSPGAFAPGAVVLPIQRGLASGLRTGDAVNLIPQTAPDRPSPTLLIRYAYEPDPPGSELAVGFDRRLDRIPTWTSIASGAWDAVVGTGWSGQLQRPILRPALVDPAVALGSAASGASAAAMSIDGIATTGLVGSRALAWLDGAGAARTGLGDGTGTLPAAVTLSDNLSSPGIVLIDGEAFAVRPTQSGEPAGMHRILARGLLGSGRQQHAAPPAGGFPVLPVPDLGIARIPATATGSQMLGASLPITSASRWFDVWTATADQTAALNGRIVLLCDPNGEPGRFEIVRLVQNTLAGTTSYPNQDWNRYTILDWQRGLYRTTAIDWTTGDAPLIITWSPRYGSALPASGTPGAEMLRSRLYPSAGFPVRWYDVRFPTTDATSIGTAPALLNHLDAAANDTLVRFARLLTSRSGDGVDHRFDGWDTVSSEQGLGVDIPTDGGELRCWWQYRTTLDAISDPEDPHRFRALAEGMNRTPALGPVRMRAYAPCRTLAVEDAR